MRIASHQRNIRHIIAGLIDRTAVFAGLVALTFFLPRLIPGDPLELLLSADAARMLKAEEIETLRERYGLSGSWLDQFMRYLDALAHGDLGFSLRHASPVLDLLLGAAPWTLLLIAGAMPVYLLAGLCGGIEAGQSPHSARDRLITGAMIVVASVPPFAAAILLLLAFGVVWPLFPVSSAEPLFPPDDFLARGLAIARHAVLPVTALALHEIARFFFLARGEAVGLSARPFILNARARGISGWRLRLHYYGRSVVPAALARMGDSITTLFGAVFFVEVVFSYPGIGTLIYTALLERDYVLLQGAMLGMALVVLALNWVLDALVTSLATRG